LLFIKDVAFFISAFCTVTSLSCGPFWPPDEGFLPLCLRQSRKMELLFLPPGSFLAFFRCILYTCYPTSSVLDGCHKLRSRGQTCLCFTRDNYYPSTARRFFSPRFVSKKRVLILAGTSSTVNFLLMQNWHSIFFIVDPDNWVWSPLTVRPPNPFLHHCTP